MSIHIGGDKYYSLPQAAQELGISRATLFRWITNGVRLNGARLRAVRDPISRRYYIRETEVEVLARRFEQVPER